MGRQKSHHRGGDVSKILVGLAPLGGTAVRSVTPGMGETGIHSIDFLHMEQAMRTTSLDVTVIRQRRALRRAAIIGGAAAVATALLFAQPFSFPRADQKAATDADVSQPVAAPRQAALEPATFEIVTSPVIETNPQFFFGSGDGSSGYYAERPQPAERKPDLVRYERLP